MAFIEAMPESRADHLINLFSQNLIAFDDFFHANFNCCRVEGKDMPIRDSTRVLSSLNCLQAPFNMFLKVCHRSSNSQQSGHRFIAAEFVYRNCLKGSNDAAHNRGIIFQHKAEIGKVITIKRLHHAGGIGLCGIGNSKNCFSFSMCRKDICVFRSAEHSFGLSFPKEVCPSDRPDRTKRPNPIGPFRNSHLVPRNRAIYEVQKLKSDCKHASYCEKPPISIQRFVSLGQWLQIYKFFRNHCLSGFNLRKRNTASIGGGK